MKTFNAESFTAAGKAAAEEVSHVAQTAYAGLEKLAQVNLAASKAALNDSLDSLKDLAAAQSPQEAIALQAKRLQPLAAKAAEYGQTVLQIATETSTALGKASEGKFAMAQKSFGEFVANATKNAPAGSEAFMAAFKQASAAGEQAMKSAQEIAQKAFAQGNAVVTDVVAKAASAAPKA